MDMISDIPWQMAEDWNQVLSSFKAVENKGKDKLTELFVLQRKFKKIMKSYQSPWKAFVHVHV
jgi:hypothetical protein